MIIMILLDWLGRRQMRISSHSPGLTGKGEQVGGGRWWRKECRAGWWPHLTTPVHARDCLLIPVCHLLPYKYYRLHNPPPSLPCHDHNRIKPVKSFQVFFYIFLDPWYGRTEWAPSALLKLLSSLCNLWVQVVNANYTTTMAATQPTTNI